MKIVTVTMTFMKFIVVGTLKQISKPRKVNLIFHLSFIGYLLEIYLKLVFVYPIDNILSPL